MAKVLQLTVVQHPTRYTPVVLHPGQELPEWAMDLVTNPEVVDGVEPAQSETETPSETPGGDEDTQGDTNPVEELPDSSWTNDNIRAFAAERGIDLGDASTKADMLRVIHDVHDFLNQEAGSEDDA